MGVDMANDGTLSIDSTKLSDALANRFSNVQDFFQSAGSVTGFANNFSTDLIGLTDSTTGVISANLTENKSLQTLLTRQITDFEDRLAVRQQELIKQYSRVDTMLRQFPLIMSQITSQLAVLQNQGL
jgi:flagellar hook-associated protein 2